LTYHDQTRTGLLARYAATKPDLLRQAAALAAPAYLQHDDPKLAGTEALFCWVVAGQQDEAQQLLTRLIDELGRRSDWDGLLVLFTTCDQAVALPFVEPLTYTAFHEFARGLALQQIGNQAKAIVAYQASIAGDDKFAYPWNWLGNVYYNSKAYDAAIKAYQQAIACDDKFAAPWNGLGNVYQDRKEYVAAIEAYQQAIARDNQYATPWNNLSTAYNNLKRYAEAIDAYRAAVALDDKYATPWSRPGNVYSDLKRYAEAINDYRAAIVRDDKDARPWNSLGLVYRNLQCYAEAIDAYQQAIARDDKDADPWNNLGNVYRDRKEYDAAIDAYQQAIARDDEDAAAYHRNLGSTLRLLERWSNAETAIRRSLALNPADRASWIGLADIARRRQDEQAWQEAIERAQPLVDYTDFYNAACFESVAGNADKALELLAQAAAEEGFDPEWAQRDPDLAWIRDDPRFGAIVQRAGHGLPAGVEENI